MVTANLPRCAFLLGARFASRLFMLPEEDEAPYTDHSVELMSNVGSPFPTRRRRIAQVAVAAILLGAAGLIALAFTEHRRALNAERALENAESTQPLGSLAAQEAQAAEEARATAAPNAAAQPPPDLSSAPPPATTNIVIVNPPAPAANGSSRVAAPRAASGSLPAPALTAAVPIPNVSSADNGNGNNGTSTVYVPTPVLPNATTGTNIPAQSVNNGSLPNPALPNGSSDVPTPGQPNGAGTSVPSEPSTPVGSVPASPPPSGVTP